MAFQILLFSQRVSVQIPAPMSSGSPLLGTSTPGRSDASITSKLTHVHIYAQTHIYMCIVYKNIKINKIFLKDLVLAHGLKEYSP